MNLRPLHQNIIVERFETESKTKGGLIIPDCAQEKKLQGTIVAIGKKVTDVKVGDVALFSKWSEKEAEVDGKKYLIMHETDILVIL